MSLKQLCPAYAVHQRVPGRARESDVREEYEGGACGDGGLWPSSAPGSRCTWRASPLSPAGLRRSFWSQGHAGPTEPRPFLAGTGDVGRGLGPSWPTTSSTRPRPRVATPRLLADPPTRLRLLGTCQISLSRKETVIAPPQPVPHPRPTPGRPRSRRVHAPGWSRLVCGAEYPAEVAVLDTLPADRPVTVKSTRAIGMGSRV